MKGDFVKQGKEEMHGFILKAIDDLLSVLNSKIEYPRNINGAVLEHKLISCVKAREQIYIDLSDLMDKIDIDREDKKYKTKIIEGLKNTWHELTLITVWDIGNYEFGESDEENFLTTEDKKQMAMESVADNIKASVSTAKKLSAMVAFKILDRIKNLEMTESEKEKEMEEFFSANTIERYVEN